MAATKDKNLAKKLEIITHHESRFLAAVERARLSKVQVDDAQIDQIRKGFEDLRKSVLQPAEGLPAPSLAIVEEQACRLGRLRCYVLPVPEVLNLGMSAESELREWRVPQEVRDHVKSLIDAAKAELAKGTTADEKTVRAAINEILFTRDTWKAQFEKYADSLRSLTLNLAIVLVVMAALALWLQNINIGLGFLCAGLCGTAASILTKPPALTVFGESVGTTSRIIGRFAAGFMGTMLGYALLTLNVVSINIGEFKDARDLIDRVTACSEMRQQAKLRQGMLPAMVLDMRTDGESSLVHDGGTARDAGPVVDRLASDGGPALDGGITALDGGLPFEGRVPVDGGIPGTPAGAPRGVGPPSGPGEQPPSTLGSKPTESQCVVVGACDCTQKQPRWVALLLALGLLLGFSERAATSFEERLFGDWSRPAK